MYIRSIESDYFDDYEFNQENLMTGYKIIEELNAPAYIESNPTMWREKHTRNMQFGAEPTNIIFDAVSDEYKTRGAHAEVIYTGIESAFRAMQHRILPTLTVNGRYSAAGLIAELAQAVNIWMDMQLLDIAPERDIELDFQDWGFDATILELAHSVCQYWGLEFFTSYNPTTNKATLNFTQRVGEVKEDAFQYLVDIEQTDVFYDRTDLKTVVTGYRPDGSTRTFFWEDMQLETGVHATHPSVDLPEGLTAIGEINYLQGILSDTLNYGMEVKLVESDLDYAHINIGDTIWVLDERLGMKVNIRVTKKTTHYDAVNKVRRVDLELGSRGQIKSAGIHSPMTPPGVQSIVGENIHDHILEYHSGEAEGVTDPLHLFRLAGKSTESNENLLDRNRKLLIGSHSHLLEFSDEVAEGEELNREYSRIEFLKGYSYGTTGFRENDPHLKIDAGGTGRLQLEGNSIRIETESDTSGGGRGDIDLEAWRSASIRGSGVSLSASPLRRIVSGKYEDIGPETDGILQIMRTSIFNSNDLDEHTLKNSTGFGIVRYHSLWKYKTDDADARGRGHYYAGDVKYGEMIGGYFNHLNGDPDADPLPVFDSPAPLSRIATSGKFLLHSDENLVLRGQQVMLQATDFFDPKSIGVAPHDVSTEDIPINYQGLWGRRVQSDLRGLRATWMKGAVIPHAPTFSAALWRLMRMLLHYEKEQGWSADEYDYLSSEHITLLNRFNFFEASSGNAARRYGIGDELSGSKFLERTTTPVA